MKLVILGGGPGGYAAAIRGAQLGAEVTIIEERKIGGVCLNTGCIPTKTLLRAARWLHEQEKMEAYGIDVQMKLDFGELMQRKKEVVEQLTANVEMLLAAHRISTIAGRGIVKNSQTVKVATEEGVQDISFDKLILATGSRPMMPPVSGLDLPQVVDSTGALSFKEIPKRLTILGGGVIAVEFAILFEALGSKVTMMEMLPTILPREDELVQEAMTEILRQRGINVYTDATLKKVEKAGDGLKLTATGVGIPEFLETKNLLVATGRQPNVEGIGLETLGIKVHNKAVEINEYLETNVSGIYAIGDLTAKMMLAHTAAHQGLLAAENAMGQTNKMDYRSIPGGLYTFPEAASVGITEQEARKTRGDIKVGLFPYEALGKALADYEMEGFIKIIATAETNEILGVHILGDRATDLIAEGALAIGMEACLEEVAHQVHGHPTFNEGMGEAAMAALGLPLHLFPK
ncbi:dihydrolipoyl dehydrogenase [Tindallia californiensis]|uniref:Dihydrolipoyl dehydrogenase n=1 Tax=Tindallia californiensis TaxID=159292 RepID=A0A1H3IZS0_9FIRM|nr:dihydrolipoyl dehydrogenase [Tindallia californiensis]SDY33243.1 dihydrolipoamide dehydrogenase [Tindallia californiensis]